MADMNGRYKGKIEVVEYRVSAKKDTPCLHATCLVTEEGPHLGRRLPWEGWLTDTAVKRTYESLAFGGCTFPVKQGETKQEVIAAGADPRNFEGCDENDVELVVETDEIELEATAEYPNPRKVKSTRVSFINRLGGEGRTTKKIDDAQRDVLAMSFLGVVAQVKAEQEGRASKGGDASFDPKAIEKGAPAAAGAKKKGMY
jgi:hypothetical protein